jgi:hypothetical protein
MLENQLISFKHQENYSIKYNEDPEEPPEDKCGLFQFVTFNGYFMRFG